MDFARTISLPSRNLPLYLEPLMRLLPMVERNVVVINSDPGYSV